MARPTPNCLIVGSPLRMKLANTDVMIKQFGVGLATAVLLAGILVVTLAPAAITLMGEAAWWLPGWLDWLLPHIDIEGEGAVADKPMPGAHAGGAEAANP